MMRYFVYEIYKTKSYLIVDCCVGEYRSIEDATARIVELIQFCHDHGLTNKEYVIMPRFKL